MAISHHRGILFAVKNNDARPKGRREFQSRPLQDWVSDNVG